MPLLEIPLIFDSSQASLKTDDGSQFTVNLEEPLKIPIGALEAYIQVYGCTVWNNIYNVNTGVNNLIYVAYFDGLTLWNEIITLEAGLYDVDHLNAALKRELNNNANLPSDLFTIVPDTASNKAVIQFNYSGTQLDFTQALTIRGILGFDSRLVPLAQTTGVEYVLGDTVANFNNIEYFTIGSDLIHRGIRINDRFNQTLVKVPIDADPGSQINYQPFSPQKIPCNELIGTEKKEITLWLTNNLLQRVDTNGEAFSITMSIHYVV